VSEAVSYFFSVATLTATFLASSSLNVKGLWQCCKAVTPVMRKQAKGKIINIASGTFWLGVPYLLHYVSSKGAVIAFHAGARARTLG
jgi:3-oxoacyl-[acyl-carrier protein] reductase